MANKQSHASDLLGLTRLTTSAVVGVAELAEALHMAVLHKAIGTPAVKPIAGATKLVYSGVRGIARLAGAGVDTVLERLIPVLGEQRSWSGREALLAAVNGVLGDHLEAAGNPLAIPMTLRRGGVPLVLERAALQQALPDANGRIVVLLHGLCMNDLQFLREGHDHGAALQRDLGYTPVYLHYNSGRHISSNGHDFASLMERLVKAWPQPVTELVIVGHSMGGLVTRSAYQLASEAGMSWTKLLDKIVFLGSPHHGAPLERGGNWVHIFTDLTPYSRPFSRLAKVRSAGITDLRHGSVSDADWEGRDRFAHGGLPHSVPLPASVKCYAVAATVGAAEGTLADRAIGDGLVPLASALGKHEDPARCLQFTDQWTGYQLNHMQLLSDPRVYQQLRAWLAPAT